MSLSSKHIIDTRESNTYNVEVPAGKPQAITLEVLLPPGRWEIITSIGRESGLMFISRGATDIAFTGTIPPREVDERQVEH